jgi:hypothetical protein
VAQDGLILTEAQMIALERKQEKLEACGEIETEHPGYLVAQDTYYVGTIKGVGRIYQQTVIDTYSRVAFANLYTSKHAITSADVLNDRVIPFFEQHQIPILRMLTDRGTEFNGRPENHEYELYLQLEAIDHSRQKCGIPNQMVFANDCTARCKTSFTLLLSVGSFTRIYQHFKPIWMSGSSIIMRSDLTVAVTALVKPPCKHLWNPLTWPNKNC